MIDPSLVKTVGFIAAVVGTVGSAAVLFLPRRLTKWEKFIRIAFIAIALLGIISNRIGSERIGAADVTQAREDAAKANERAAEA